MLPASVFDSFDNLDEIPPEAVAFWLKPQPNLIVIENYLANRILYPQAIPQTVSDLQIDLAILREALKLNSSPFLNKTMRKILIPVKFVNFFQDLKVLTWVFIDALVPGRDKKDLYQDLWTICLTGEVDEAAGTVILPQFSGTQGEIELLVLDKKYKIRPGSLTVIPCPEQNCKISYQIKNGRILGKEQNTLQVYGGKLGLMIDGRRL